MMAGFESVVAVLCALLACRFFSLAVRCLLSAFCFSAFCSLWSGNRPVGVCMSYFFILLLHFKTVESLELTAPPVSPLLVRADAAPAVSASTFYLAETETQFSVNIANDSSDVFIYFTSPAYSWVGVGFGEGMKDSFMLIMYPSKDGNSEFLTSHNHLSRLEITVFTLERWQIDMRYRRHHKSPTCIWACRT
jgi:hypothetical protein